MPPWSVAAVTAGAVAFAAVTAGAVAAALAAVAAAGAALAATLREQGMARRELP